MAVDMKQIVRRFYEEAYGKGNSSAFDEVCDAAYRGHDPVNGDVNLEQARASAQGYKAAFPDLKPQVLASYVDGDCCITQWRMTGTHRAPLMGIQPTGARCVVEGISIARFRGAKIIEQWAHWDALGLFKQLGVAPAMRLEEGAREARPHA
jgi:predicted ester cyclase